MKRILLDMVPVAFQRPRFNLGRGFNAKKYAVFKTSARTLVFMQFKELPMSGPLSVNLVFTIQKPRTVKRDWPTVVPDLDNYVKGVFDVGNDLLWNDDCQIVHHQALKQYGERPSILIEVKRHLRRDEH